MLIEHRLLVQSCLQIRPSKHFRWEQCRICLYVLRYHGWFQRVVGGDRESGPPPGKYKWVSLEILVQTLFEKQLDPLGAIFLKGGPYGPL